MDGDCAQHSITVLVVENAAEDYDVLVKIIIYNKHAKNPLLPVLFDELHMFSMKLTSDLKWLSIQLMKDG